MPDIKEKLVELMELNIDYGLADILADHLIANGVTIQTWISVEERLPERGRVVLCYFNYEPESGNIVCENRYIGSGHWQSEESRVTHWMPLPEPPKGE